MNKLYYYASSGGGWIWEEIRPYTINPDIVGKISFVSALPSLDEDHIMIDEHLTFSNVRWYNNSIVLL